MAFFKLQSSSPVEDKPMSCRSNMMKKEYKAELQKLSYKTWQDLHVCFDIKTKHNLYTIDVICKYWEKK